MKIRQIEVFQLAWAPDDSPAQRSAFVRVHTDDGLWGIGEASPMQGGLASLGIIAHDLQNPFLAEMASFVEREVARFGYAAMFCANRMVPGVLAM